jgi:hypothetical protein
MSFVANTDALIFDLRENDGGDPSMVDFMVSHLFKQPAHINDLTAREWAAKGQALRQQSRASSAL